MITTLLFDLDDTLLGNDMGTFLPAYFERLTRYFAGVAGSERLIQELVTATRAMAANTDPERTLFEVFTDCFSEAIGWPPEEWRPRLDHFYAQAYRELEPVTRRRPAARDVMSWAFAQGYEVAIATSPVFPLSAIRERLRWAGIDDFPYALITNADSNHFAKPHPEFFAEVLGRLGRRPDQALLIGNDWNDDIVPAAALGLSTYWITSGGVAPEAVLSHGWGAGTSLDWVDAQPLGSGRLEEFLGWAPRLTEASAPAATQGPGMPYLLAGNLATLQGELAHWPAVHWPLRPASSEWSLTEIICHLRDVEREVNLPRLRTVIETDDPFISGADTDPWAIERDYPSQSGPEALKAFTAARRSASGYLRAQPKGVWSRTARHAILGPTRLVEIVGWILDHDLIHLDQVRQTKARVSG